MAVNLLASFPENTVLLADATVTTIVILSLIAAAAVAGTLILAGRKKQEGSLADQPPQLSSRGSYIPLVFGQRRVGPVIGWVGDKEYDDGDSGGGSDTSEDPQGPTYYGGAWHILCVGPAYGLYRIRDQEADIFTTPITSDDTPSGTVMECTDGSTFEIYWGECDQPINEELAIRLGVASRWPNICYIRWIKKKLGGSNAWPTLDYDIEVRPASTLPTLEDSGSWIGESEDAPPAEGTTVWFNQGEELPAGDYIIRYVRGALLYNNGNPGEWQLNTDDIDAGLRVGWHVVDEDIAQVIECPGTQGTYGNQAGVEQANPTETTFANFSWGGGKLGLYLHDPDNYEDNQPGAPSPTYQLEDTDGNVYQVSGLVGPQFGLLGSGDSGYNAGHMLWQFLTAVYPHGIGMPVTDFDFEGFENVGRWSASERLALNAIAEEGETADEFLKAMMSEIGMFLSPVGTVLRPVMLRRPTVASPTIPRALQLEIYPEEDHQQGSFLPDRAMFLFNDRVLNFRGNSADIRADGRARVTNRPQQQNIKLNFVTDMPTARSVANRRGLEFTTRGREIKPSSTRDFRLAEFHPGRTFYLEGDPTLYRLMAKDLSTTSPEVKLNALADTYLTVASNATVDVGIPSGMLPRPAAPDLAVRAVVLPEELAPNGPAIAVFRVRAHTQIVGARILMSTDDVTYFELGEQTYYNLAGTLNRPFPLTEGVLDGDGNLFVASGPSFTVLGFDIDQVLDLTGNDGAYEDSRQLLLIDDELSWLRSIATVSGGYQLLDITRERLDTWAADHLSLAQVWVVLRNRVKPFSTSLAVSGNTLYIKTVPFTISGDTVDPASVTPYELVIP